MAFKQGEVYKCPDPNCGCEFTCYEVCAANLSRNAKSELLLRERDET